jgi:hypothetical protein
MIEEVMNRKSAVYFIEEATRNQRRRQLARFSGPAGRELHIGGITHQRLAILIADLPNKLEQAVNVRFGQPERMNESLELGMQSKARPGHKMN